MRKIGLITVCFILLTLAAGCAKAVNAPASAAGSVQPPAASESPSEVKQLTFHGDDLKDIILMYDSNRIAYADFHSDPKLEEGASTILDGLSLLKLTPQSPVLSCDKNYFFMEYYYTLQLFANDQKEDAQGEKTPAYEIRISKDNHLYLLENTDGSKSGYYKIDNPETFGFEALDKIIGNQTGYYQTIEKYTPKEIRSKEIVLQVGDNTIALSGNEKQSLLDSYDEITAFCLEDDTYDTFYKHMYSVGVSFLTDSSYTDPYLDALEYLEIDSDSILCPGTTQYAYAIKAGPFLWGNLYSMYLQSKGFIPKITGINSIRFTPVPLNAPAGVKIRESNQQIDLEDPEIIQKLTNAFNTLELSTIDPKDRTLEFYDKSRSETVMELSFYKKGIDSATETFAKEDLLTTISLLDNGKVFIDKDDTDPYDRISGELSFDFLKEIWDSFK
jgi:hypothetical protein